MGYRQRVARYDAEFLPGFTAAALKIRSRELRGKYIRECLCEEALELHCSSAEPTFMWRLEPIAKSTFAVPQPMVKTNITAVLRRELARRTWRQEPVAFGLESDPYQWPEGHYQLMPGMIGALVHSGTPFFIQTTETLLYRDLPLLASAGSEVGIGIQISISTIDEVLLQIIDFDSPVFLEKIQLISAINDAGLLCKVVIDPVIPYLTDQRNFLQLLIAKVAAAGAQGIDILPLRLNDQVRAWFMPWLAGRHPALLRRYRKLYSNSENVRADYLPWLDAQLLPILGECAPIERCLPGLTFDKLIAKHAEKKHKNSTTAIIEVKKYPTLF
ncbi:MAG: Rv2578c family radical SAM protein [Mycobacteriaceae bacterium]